MRTAAPSRGCASSASGNGAEPGESHRDPAECDIVVTVTGSPDPVLRGEWLRPGALVCAVGANDGRRRELDNVVLERATFVCCDSIEDARLESADLIEPIEAGVLDWLEVHELQEVVAGETAGRQVDDDIVVFKSNGLAAWDVAAAARRRRARGSAESSRACLRARASMSCSPSACTTSGRSSRRACCCGVSRFCT